eukprot:CAMPEP_0173192084 /NCGR_PEP_ID=MMETSP1141-20130122/13233_1 /TAXON_ID=483371 /ORGANISM="non described non described, Strain CCMP2298" /LENGTH=41 /DNA_ID= /DNA_START= /DNA_END= /DNA_ORIENTATION=
MKHVAVALGAVDVRCPVGSGHEQGQEAASGRGTNTPNTPTA